MTPPLSAASSSIPDVDPTMVQDLLFLSEVDTPIRNVNTVTTPGNSPETEIFFKEQ